MRVLYILIFSAVNFTISGRILNVTTGIEKVKNKGLQRFLCSS
jgi:hypothetical protein